MIHFFIALQSVLFLCMAFHDWVDIPPLTDLPALRKAHSIRFRLLGSCINGGLVLIPLIITLFYISSPMSLWARLLITGVYGLLTMGTLTAWWVPYFGGGYWVQGNKAGLEEYRNTHSFLPARGSNVIPNTLHVILHLQIWGCFGLSLYWLFYGE